jgi:hypothetical protein
MRIPKRELSRRDQGLVYERNWARAGAVGYSQMFRPDHKQLMAQIDTASTARRRAQRAKNFGEAAKHWKTEQRGNAVWQGRQHRGNRLMALGADEAFYVEPTLGYSDRRMARAQKEATRWFGRRGHRMVRKSIQRLAKAVGA